MDGNITVHTFTYVHLTWDYAVVCGFVGGHCLNARTCTHESALKLTCAKEDGLKMCFIMFYQGFKDCGNSLVERCQRVLTGAHWNLEKELCSTH